MIAVDVVATEVEGWRGRGGVSFREWGRHRKKGAKAHIYIHKCITHNTHNTHNTHTYVSKPSLTDILYHTSSLSYLPAFADFRSNSAEMEATLANVPCMPKNGVV